MFFLNLYFCWSYSTAPTAHRRQEGPDRRGGRGGVFANIVPKEEKEGTIRKKRKRSIKKRGGQERESSINGSILNSAGFITNRVLIAFDSFS